MFHYFSIKNPIVQFVTFLLYDAQRPNAEPEDEAPALMKEEVSSTSFHHNCS